METENVASQTQTAAAGTAPENGVATSRPFWADSPETTGTASGVPTITKTAPAAVTLEDKIEALEMRVKALEVFYADTFPRVLPVQSDMQPRIEKIEQEIRSRFPSAL